MLFAVIQDVFIKLDPNRVSAVYEQLFKISKIDAQARIMNQPAGILAFGLEKEQAEEMTAKLKSLNYPCHKQAIDKLIPLHNARSIYSALFSEEGVIFENLFGKRQKILWNHVQMVEAFKLQGKSICLQNRKKAKRIGKPSTVTIKKEKINSDKFIDIYSSSPAPRLRIEASRFNYSCLGEQMSTDSQENMDSLTNIIKVYCQKYEVSFEDSSHAKTYSELKELDAYSHWKLQLLDD